jgi:hypothetical protein
MVAARVDEMHGVEAACAHFLAAELGQSEVIDPDDDEMEDEALAIPQKGGQRAARGGNDDQVQGEGETESPSDRSLGAAIGGRQMPNFDPERHLLVEDEPDALGAILEAGTERGAPVRVPLTIIVYPRDATGFVRVVHEREASDQPEDFSSIDDEDGPSHKSLPGKKPLPPQVRPKTPLGKRKLNRRPWPRRSTLLFAK